MRLFHNTRKKESADTYAFDKQQVLSDISDLKEKECSGWDFIYVTEASNNPYDFLAIYTETINKEIRLKSNPFSEYKKIVESEYQIVRAVFIMEGSVESEFPNYVSNYKIIQAISAKELFIKLKNEILYD